MNAANTPVSIFVSKQLPGFVREDNPLMVEFLEAYYEYLEQANTSVLSGSTIDRAKNLLAYSDIDTTIPSFSAKLYAEFLRYFPQSALADRTTILKNAKDFYRARGTEKSFKFLFHALYGLDAEIYKPKDDILVASSGKWLVEKSLRVTSVIINGVADSSLTGLQMFQNTKIVGGTSGSSAYVERVLLTYENGFLKAELFLSNQTADFTNGETISATDINGNVLSATILSGIISQVTITSAGSLYNVGDPLVFTSNAGSGGAAIVSSVTTGSIVSVFVLNGGAGFRAGDLIQFTGGGGTGANANVLTLAGTANSFYHPNTYNISFDAIGPYLNTVLGNANLGFPAYANANLNTVLSQAFSTFTFSNTGPILSIGIVSSGSGYLSTPVADPLGNTFIKSLGILGRMQINNGGTGYANGDILTFNNGPGGSGYGANANVVSVNATGAIERVAFVPVSGQITGGSGYTIDNLPTITITTAGGSGANITVSTLLAHGSPGTSIGVSSGTFGSIESITITNRGSGYTTAPTISLSGSGDGTAQAYANIVSGVYTYPGRYLDDTGFLSSFNFLQDRDYYQNFSYVIKVRESIANYSKAVRELVHPTGMRMWGEYTLTEDAGVNSMVAASNTTVTLA